MITAFGIFTFTIGMIANGVFCTSAVEQKKTGWALVHLALFTLCGFLLIQVTLGDR